MVCRSCKLCLLVCVIIIVGPSLEWVKWFWWKESKFSKPTKFKKIKLGKELSWMWSLIMSGVSKIVQIQLLFCSCYHYGKSPDSRKEWPLYAVVVRKTKVTPEELSVSKISSCLRQTEGCLSLEYSLQGVLYGQNHWQKFFSLFPWNSRYPPSTIWGRKEGENMKCLSEPHLLVLKKSFAW